MKINDSQLASNIRGWTATTTWLILLRFLLKRQRKIISSIHDGANSACWFVLFTWSKTMKRRIGYQKHEACQKYSQLNCAVLPRVFHPKSELMRRILQRVFRTEWGISSNLFPKHYMFGYTAGWVKESNVLFAWRNTAQLTPKLCSIGFTAGLALVSCYTTETT